LRGKGEGSTERGFLHGKREGKEKAAQKRGKCVIKIRRGAGVEVGGRTAKHMRKRGEKKLDRHET